MHMSMFEKMKGWFKKPGDKAPEAPSLPLRKKTEKNLRLARPENLPPLDRIRVIGSAHETIKQHTRTEARADYWDYREALGRDEEHEAYLVSVEKEPDERILEIARQCDVQICKDMDEILTDEDKEHGIVPVPLPLDNIHIIDEKEFERKFPGVVGRCAIDLGVVYISEKATRNEEELRKLLLHELWHSKGFVTIEIKKRENGERRNRQRVRTAGATMNSIREQKTHFVGFEEAIVSMLEIRSFHRLPQDEKLQARKERAALSLNIPRQEVTAIDEKGRVYIFPYYEQRKTVWSVIDAIRKDAKEEVTRDEVLNIFARARLNGRVLEAARLVEESFGKGSFRKLSEMNGSDESAREVQEDLRRMRIQEFSRRAKRSAA